MRGLGLKFGMATKRCFKCKQTKPLSLFYKHPRMADGHLNKCKHCAKRDVQLRYDNPQSRALILAYERKRNGTPERRAARAEYQRRRRESSPGKRRCHYWTSNAIRDGRIIRKPCEVCGNDKSEAHHDDYRKPQCIRWFCFKHHREVGHGQKVGL